MENFKIAGLISLLVGVFALSVIFILFYPFIVAIGLKWFAWIAGKAGVDAVLLTHCCYLMAIAQACGRKREIHLTKEQFEALRIR